MRFGKAFVGIGLVLAVLGSADRAFAKPPADDFLNPQDPGARLTLFPFVGPGFRANYDQRFQIEKDMSELRLQLTGTVAVPFSELSANVDVRFFVMTFGASAGYHNEWHLLQFNPSAATGRDRAGQPADSLDLVRDPNDPNALPRPVAVARPAFNDLHRDARVMKDQNADIQSARWAYYEGRWGFVWPAYNFMGSSTLALRSDKRPDVSYDWENGTVMNGGWHLRWEGYALFRERNTGFIGPALRALVVPRNRVKGDFTTQDGFVVPDGSACREKTGIACTAVREFEFHYGVLAGIRPNWVDSSDLFLIRAYTTAGLNNQLFGTHLFRMPLQLLVGYMADFNL